ncbi:hypothetical protein HK100_007273 [Physocladia obscura]|uniref:Protein kinase domain-containing protein n=1 Tax=Physocladia obscura TaxID=109957 RepID=A0AAD5T5E9_9FUNG|nr:hypothetical protein HK100_007273 [Physocladia obscura]
MKGTDDSVVGSEGRGRWLSKFGTNGASSPVARWNAELVAAWMNNTVMSSAITQMSSSDNTNSSNKNNSNSYRNANTSFTVVNRAESSQDLTFQKLARLDSVFNIGVVAAHHQQQQQLHQQPILQVTNVDLVGAGIHSGADLLAADNATLDSLVGILRNRTRAPSPLDFSLLPSILADAITELKWQNDILLQRFENQSESASLILPRNTKSKTRQMFPPLETKHHPELHNFQKTNKEQTNARSVVNKASDLDNSLALTNSQSIPATSNFEDSIKFFSNDTNPAAANIWKKCVKVYLVGMVDTATTMIDISTRMIDISKAVDGAAIRSEILSHFRLPQQARKYMALYAVKDAAGNFDANEPVDDEYLLMISKYFDVNFRHLALTTTKRTCVKVCFSPDQSDFYILDTSMFFDGVSIRKAICDKMREKSSKTIEFDILPINSDTFKPDHNNTLNDDDLYKFLHNSTTENLCAVYLSVFQPEKYLRVYSLLGKTQIIDTSKHLNGETCRHEIYKIFQLFTPDQQAGYGIYELNTANQLECLNDKALHQFPKSAVYDRNDLVFLLHEREVETAMKNTPQVVLTERKSQNFLKERTSHNILSERNSRDSLVSVNPDVLPSLSLEKTFRMVLRNLQRKKPSPTPIISTQIDISSQIISRDNVSIFSGQAKYKTVSRRLSNPSIFSITSAAFPGERPAVETIAENLELFFPMQHLDKSDAMHGVLWYNEEDVQGSVDGDSHSDDEEEWTTTRVSSIKKADVTASIYNQERRTSYNHDSRKSFALSEHSVLQKQPQMPPHQFPMPPEPPRLLIPNKKKNSTFRDRLRRLGSSGLFMTRDPSSLTPPSSPQKLISSQNIVSNLAQVGLLDRKTIQAVEALQSTRASANSSPVEVKKFDFDIITDNLLKRSASVGELNSAAVPSIHIQPIDDSNNEENDTKSIFNVAKDDVTSPKSQNQETIITVIEDNSLSKDQDEDDKLAPLHIEWNGFAFKPNPSLKSNSEVSRRNSARLFQLSMRKSMAVSEAKELELRISSESRRLDTGIIDENEELISISPQINLPSHKDNLHENLMPPSPTDSQSIDTIKPLVEISTPTTPVDTAAHSLFSSTSSFLPSIFTEDDATAPIRRRIRWLKGDMIGSGSFGRVYYGVNLITKEVMAVKQIDVIPVSRYQKKNEAEKNREKMIEALRTEIMLLHELNHENVVRYLGFDIDNTLVSVFLEYVSGGSVASMTSRFGRFEKELCQSLLVQITNGLAYLHEQCIIHRDIKGGNILVSKGGIVKISDFGISKKNDLDFAYQKNSKLEFAGSILWMAPESTKRLGYSAKIDIWALGCVGLEMMSGAHPWKGKDDYYAMNQIQQGKAPPVPDGLSSDAMIFLEHCFTM